MRAKIRRRLSFDPRILLLREIRRRNLRPRHGTALRQSTVRNGQSAAAEHQEGKDEGLQEEESPLIIPSAA